MVQQDYNINFHWSNRLSLDINVRTYTEGDDIQIVRVLEDVRARIVREQTFEKKKY